MPLILVRHASAGRKSDRPDDDLGRPLDAEGTADAAALAALLACYATEARVLSSPALRCTATVAPYAARGGLPVEIVPSLATGQPPPAVRPAPSSRPAEVAAAVAVGGRPAVICAHRENLPVLLGVICGELGSPPPGGVELRKGGFWVLHTARGQLAATERGDNSQRPVPAIAAPPGGR